MDQAEFSPPEAGDIQKLDNVTWFGHCVIHLASALRDLPTTDARLLLIQNLMKYMDRQKREIRRHKHDGLRQ